MSFHHFIKHGGLLKTVKRTGWLRYLPSEKVESVCDHSYRVGLISILLLDQPNIDSGRCVQIALLHDLAESLVGDITPMCKVSKEEK
jgi:putative hydrolase of HD superfamily